MLTIKHLAFHENLDAFRKYFFRPRVLRDMTEGTTETTILGIPTAMPFLISAAAMVKLGHPLGEVNLTRAAGHYGLVQMVGLGPILSPTANANKWQPWIDFLKRQLYSGRNLWRAHGGSTSHVPG